MKPITRKEMLMAKAAGQDVPDITPVTREEYFLPQIANGGGGGGGGGSSVTIAECSYNSGTHTFTSTLTAGEMLAAYKNGVLIMHCDDETNDTFYTVTSQAVDTTGYYIFTIFQGAFFADAESGYPTYTVLN